MKEFGLLPSRNRAVNKERISTYKIPSIEIATIKFNEIMPGAIEDENDNTNNKR